MLMLGRKPVSPLCMPYAGFEKATNCILEIPQNIKMTLENNVLTLKAGSILTRTGDTYTTITTATDKTYTVSSNQGTGKYVVLCQQDNGTIDSIVKVNEIHSGTTAQRPENVSIGYRYFNVDTKRWNLKESSAWNENWAICYPICVIDVDSNHVASFAKDSNGNDMIFNGAGFIGHHAFVYPNVKGLIPDGFNKDGTLKSTVTVTNALYIKELSNYDNSKHNSAIAIATGHIDRWRGYYEVDNEDEMNNMISSIPNYNFIRFYIKNKNIIKAYNGDGWVNSNFVCVAFYNYNGTTVTDFTIQQPLTKYRWVVKLIP